MKRSITQWINCDPAAMASDQSEAARFYAFRDAKADITALHRAVLILIGDDDGMTNAERHQLARRVITEES